MSEDYYDTISPSGAAARRIKRSRQKSDDEDNRHAEEDAIRQYDDLEEFQHEPETLDFLNGDSDVAQLRRKFLF